MSDPADAVFSALADATRRELLRSVAREGPISATALARDLPISRQAVAKHLGILDGAGLVVSSKHGRETRYEADPAPLAEVTSWVDRVGEQWDDRLTRLQRKLGG